jgi:hypothetical protein
LDEELRPSIDRLISAGGRLTVTGSGGGGPTVVTLDQPGSRFGILEVHGRADLVQPDEAVTTALLAAGWADPSVTKRLGREFRIGGPDVVDQRVVLARTWRVPPVLASEIALDVRTAAGTIERVALEGIGGRGSPAVTAPRSEDPRSVAAAQIEDLVDERLDGAPEAGTRRLAARTVPAPLRAIGAVVLVVVIGVAWVGMIRGAPRVAGGSTSTAAARSTSPTGEAASSGRPASSLPSAAASSAAPEPDEIPVHLVGASTETSIGPATAAVDGDPATAWRAAVGVPQWIEIALDAPATVHEVVMRIAQATPGPSRHMIQVAKPDGVYEVAGFVDRAYSDGESILFRPKTPLDGVDRIRIETMTSPSDAGWYEVVVR